MLKQQEILNQIAQKLHSSAPNTYEKATLEFRFSKEDSWSSFSAWFTIDGKNTIPDDFETLKNDEEQLLNQLHSIMNESKDNDWKKITLVIGKDRKVSVDFDYSDQSL